MNNIIVCDVPPCRFLHNYRNFIGSSSLHFQDRIVSKEIKESNSLTPKMEAVCFSEIMVYFFQISRLYGATFQKELFFSLYFIFVCIISEHQGQYAVQNRKYHAYRIFILQMCAYLSMRILLLADTEISNIMDKQNDSVTLENNIWREECRPLGCDAV
jgi:hypothetical protein